MARLIETYQSLSEHNIEYSELDKLRHLRNHMLVSGEMAKDYWINDWEKDVTTAIRHNTELGTPVVFIDWTTRLINGEADYFKKLKKKNTTISSTNRGPGNATVGTAMPQGASRLQGAAPVRGSLVGNLRKLRSTRSILQSFMVMCRSWNRHRGALCPRSLASGLSTILQSHVLPSSSPTPTPTPTPSTINPTTTATRRQSSSVKYHQQRLMVLRTWTMSTMTSFLAILILD